jgi:hypothetical protein
MFKALHRLTGEAIILLEPRWQRQLDTLRGYDAQDILVCQGCFQPVRVRAGEVKRWHFAHKHLQNCPYESESYELLQTRAVLYEWLVSRLGAERISLEKSIALPRPVDCWVNYAAGSVGYWIIDSRMPPEERLSLSTGLGNSCAHPIWVFTASMLHTDADSLERLYLTTTEREFMRHTDFDEPVQSSFSSPGASLPGASLHYLDANQDTLLTFRGLQVYHRPQLYSGYLHENRLSQVSLVPETGEFVHPGEEELLERYRIAITGRALQQHKTEQRIAQKMAELFGNTEDRPAPPAGLIGALSSQTAEEGDVGVPVCVFCGKKTDNYWYLNRVDNTCKCRDCYRQGKY